MLARGCKSPSRRSDTTDYTNATTAVSINVNQATPTITWTTPAAITYGMVLSGYADECYGVGGGHDSVQPGSGNGAQRRYWPDVEVTLTPTDTTDYTNATTAV